MYLAGSVKNSDGTRKEDHAVHSDNRYKPKVTVVFLSASVSLVAA
jgi:hypothetical protein